MAFKALMTPAVNQTRAQIEAIGAANNGVAGFWYMTSDTNAAGQQMYGVGQTDGSIVFMAYEGAEPLQAVGNTATVTMSVDGNGKITSNAKLSAASDNVLSAEADGLYVKDLAIATGSQSHLSYDAATRTIGITALGVTTVNTDTTAADLAAFVTASYTAGDEYQEGDVIILTQNSKAYIHNGGTAGDATDFTLLETPDLNAAEIQALFSSGNAGITYANGVFTLTLDPAAANDLSVTDNGLILDVSASDVTDTNDLLGSGAAVEVTLQTLLDGISGYVGSQINDNAYTFDLQGDIGSETIAVDTTLTIEGGNLLKTALVSNGTGTVDVAIDFDTAGGTAGQVIAINDAGTGVEYVDIQSPLSFENGLTEDGGVVKLGGVLTESTIVDIGNNIFSIVSTANSSGLLLVGGDAMLNVPENQKATIGYVTNDSSLSGDTPAALQVDTGTNVSSFSGDVRLLGKSEIEFTSGEVTINEGSNASASYIGTLPFSVGDVVYTPGIGNLPAGYYTIVTDTGTSFTFDFVGESTSQIPFADFSKTNGGGNLFVGNDLHINTATANRIDNFAPAVMADNTNGKIGFAPYSLPSSVGTEGQVMKVDENGNIIFGTDTSDLSFQNGLIADTVTGLVKFGGALIEETILTGDGNDFILEGSDYYTKGAVSLTDFVVTSSTDYNKIRIDQSPAGAHNFSVGEQVVINSGNPAGITQGTYSITAISVSFSGVLEQTLTLDNVQNNSEVSTTTDFTVQLVGPASGGNIFVGNTLHVGTDTLNTFATYSPAIMADTATGAIGFAPYTLPSSVGVEGQILKVDANGNLVYAIDASNLTAHNGINIDNGVIQLGGALLEDTTVSSGGFSHILAGGVVTTSTMTDTALTNRHVNETATKGIIEKFNQGAFSLSAIDPANSDAVDFKLEFDKATGAIFTDSRTTKTGIQYSGHDTADWTNDTLITKGYADGLISGAALTYENGITKTGSVVKFGGDLTGATTLDVKAFDLTLAGTGAGAGHLKSSIDMEFLSATVGQIYVAPEDNTKWRVGVSSLGNGAATFTLTAVV